MEKLVLKLLEKAKKDQEKKLKNFKILIELLKKENEHKENWKDKSDIKFWEEHYEKSEKGVKEYLEKLEGLCQEIGTLERWQRVDWSTVSVKRRIYELKTRQRARERRKKKKDQGLK